MKTGHIRITDRVYFEYYDLEKPEHDPVKYSDLGILTFKLRKAWEEYEASKQLIEAKNVMQGENTKKWYYYAVQRNGIMLDIPDGERVKINQPCKAEIIGKTATILELC